ncbi:bifunctional (p)ppGpp synthetase/guanosine-3',5'-bis(diphosphate) 3'-pyrophosphohydrolase [archaeon]|jgi:GTP diphosphokinase / guanosine-3',5'-bis(diphosphate) 3'-diphosphatase|nr:bifunctional (p)ppGpp synthetase/guanosine-3',5'-bis(diphosphate) 3'-pyrophosphohydrolase [archaeon]MBT3451058.1 bifunctional (p)ppGpp synthetase/guanosine-3',5'-bis(diphosphate) 3'-pyrophosphohydrolase [archaeon]MBT6869148.1 bifunctional (p)ppGpp synthetase/guanosine-3',5'-bis(diphosphate) 3'-pyrophosphohydrolase [archaeon]MBT7192795.1 bifunctional (p)ppGpp synthetase/guanosine-3',5'-bis(diphosphate) 3'-pyrophosphohydrolase [archaeon]MBT7381335.1 bifunctional (p)ppGpp synthetase/guanosine-3
MKVELAQKYATKYHQGQFRKNGVTPYIVHPHAVVKYLEKFGIKDEVTLSIAWLHDIVEDTPLTYSDVKVIFGKEIAEGVNYLTRNVCAENYKNRLSVAPENIKLVKLCDTLHNITTLNQLSKRGIERKVGDCLNFYIPMAQEISPELAQEMNYWISNYCGF